MSTTTAVSWDTAEAASHLLDVEEHIVQRSTYDMIRQLQESEDDQTQLGLPRETTVLNDIMSSAFVALQPCQRTR